MQSDNILDTFKDTLMYRDIFAEGEIKGKVEGKIEGVRSTLMRFVERRFPELTAQAEQVSQSIDGLERLQQIMDTVIDAQTLEEARGALKQAMS